MTTQNATPNCSKCKEETNTSACRECSKEFCSEHSVNRHQLIDARFQYLQNDYHQLREIVHNLEQDPKKHLLFEQIDQWRKDSIEKIEQTARQCREKLTRYLNTTIIEMKTILYDPKEQLEPIKDKTQLNEIDLDKFTGKLEKIKAELDQPSTIFIEQDSTPFINKIHVRSARQLLLADLNLHQTWRNHGTNEAGSHRRGDRLNELCYPCGIYIDDDQTMYIADTSNDRVMAWKYGDRSGQIVAGGNGTGDRNDQLNRPTNVLVDKENDSLIICERKNRRIVRWPRTNNRNSETIISNISCSDLIMDNDGSLYVSDFEKHEVRRWRMGEVNGTIVAGGNGQGCRLDQLDHPYWIFVDQDHSVYVSDWNNHRVMKWIKDSKEGIVVAGGRGGGNTCGQLSYPEGIIVDQLGSIYVADRHNHRVMRWLKEASEGTIVLGGHGQGAQPNQFNGPVALAFDRQKNFHVVDWGNHRVMKFAVDSA